MTWAETRRLVYALGVLAFLLLCASPFIYRYLTIPPTCVDGIQNQGEVEIDKGGPCIVRAESSILPVTIRFAKVFKVEEGIYSVVGYIENPNRDVGVRDAAYEFVLYDASGIFVASRRGVTAVPPQAVVPVFEAKITTGTQIPVRADLTLMPRTAWEKMSRRLEDLAISQPQVEQTLRSSCSRGDISCTDVYYPRVRATITNTGLESFSNVPVTVVVFDTQGNAMAASKTRVSSLTPRQSATVVYTWNSTFPSEVARVDIIPVPMSK